MLLRLRSSIARQTGSALAPPAYSAFVRSPVLPSAIAPSWLARRSMSSVFNLSRLHDKTVFITGASGGIGAATAMLFAKAGCNLILTARRQKQLDEVAAAAKKENEAGGTGKGGKVATIVLDMEDRKAVAAVLDKVPSELRHIDILVNNAGLVKGVEKVGEISEEDIDTMFNTNVLGFLTLTQVMVREFKKQRSGHIINLGSVAGREAYPGGSIYCATKHAVRAISTSLLKELVNTRVRVSEIQPGAVETEFSITRFRGDKSKADKVYDGMQPLVASDIAEEIVWVASRPDHVVVAELFVMPKAQGSPGIMHRGPLE